MQCPSCKSYSLKPTKLEYALPALICTKCHGVLISLLSYRDWAERYIAEKIKSQQADVKINETIGVILCPKCRRLMIKYSISGTHKSKIDFCNSCDEAWLDDGEWRLLKYLNLESKLASIFTIPWQRNLKKKVASDLKEQQVSELLNDDYNKVREFKKWLKSNKYCLQIMKYLDED